MRFALRAGSHGSGLTTYVVDDSGDLVIASAEAGATQDTVRSFIAYTLPQYVENLVIAGTGAVSGAGNGLSNTLDGSQNVASNDLFGGAGDDSYVLGLGDHAIEYGGQGHDEVTLMEGAVGLYSLGAFQNIEGLALGDALGESSLSGGSASDHLVGNALNNDVFGGDGDDVISDGPGRRYNQSNQTWIGQDDSDRLYGGGGNDQLYVRSDTGSDTVDGGSGNDEIHIDGTGNATVVFGRGYGQDVVSLNVLPTAQRRALLNADVSVGDIVLSRQGLDLSIAVSPSHSHPAPMWRT